MPIRSGLIVVLRVFAILLLLQIAGYILALAVTFGQGGTLPLPQIAMATLLLIPFLLIFWCSAAIVDFLAPKPEQLRPESPITASELQAIAFSATGAFILYLALGETITLLTLFHYASITPDMPSMQAPQLLKALLGWIVGIYLLLGGPGLRAFLDTARRAGPQPD